MKKHFVTFYSPGSFSFEKTTKEIEKWSIDIAIDMSKNIIERYDSKPAYFVFTTRERASNELDSKIVNRSGRYYLNGTIKTLQDIISENNPDDKILIENMKCNKIDKIIINTGYYNFTREFRPEDILLKINKEVK